MCDSEDEKPWSDYILNIVVSFSQGRSIILVSKKDGAKEGLGK
jgi:hypothetical protein